MNSNKSIEPKLFDLLFEIKPLLVKISKDEEILVLQIYKATKNVNAFIQNLLVQYFYKGYGYQIEGFNESTIDKINMYFINKTKPILLIENIKEYLIIGKDIMGNPYTRNTRELKKIYTDYLPKLLTIIMHNYKDVISNHNQIVDLINQYLSK